MDKAVLQWSCGRLLGQYPWARDFFATCGVTAPPGEQTVADCLAGLPPERLEDLGVDAARLTDRFLDFMAQMARLRGQQGATVRTITVKGGRDKDGRPEGIDLALRAGEIVAVVGPTGAGKSMLLGDIECLAQGDTPSGRYILVDHRAPEEAGRLSGEHRLVAQLSQNMNFVMDLSVGEFLALHAESRLIEDVPGAVAQVFDTAVQLAGEPFGRQTPVTALSGGQSRALMIADVACLSASPIVLIDEIENAGVDRRQALALLTRQEKIVLMATHDPLLALCGRRRVIIRNGGIAAVLETSPDEQRLLGRLEGLDARLSLLRARIRRGERLAADTL